MARILEAQHGMHRRQEALNEALKAGLEAQHAFNRQQVAINQRLATLLERAWRRWMMTRRRKRREQADPCPWLDPIWQGDDARKTGLVRGVQRRRWPPARGVSAVCRRPARRRVGPRRLRALSHSRVDEPRDGRGHDPHAAAGDPLYAMRGDGAGEGARRHGWSMILAGEPEADIACEAEARSPRRPLTPSSGGYPMHSHKRQAFYVIGAGRHRTAGPRWIT